MRSMYYYTILLSIIIGCCMGAYAETITISSISLEQGEKGTVEIYMDRAPQGLSGYTLIVEAQGAAIITGGEGPAWASLKNADMVGSALSVSAVDLMNELKPGATQILLATIAITGGTGQTTLIATVKQMDDDNGNAIVPIIIPGQITASTGTTPLVTATPTPLPTTAAPAPTTPVPTQPPATPTAQPTTVPTTQEPTRTPIPPPATPTSTPAIAQPTTIPTTQEPTRTPIPPPATPTSTPAIAQPTTIPTTQEQTRTPIPPPATPTTTPAIAQPTTVPTTQESTRTPIPPPATPTTTPAIAQPTTVPTTQESTRTPIPPPTLAPETQKHPMEIEYTLNRGWNLIGLPAQPITGDGTATIFSLVPSQGHSMFKYGASGWEKMNSETTLHAMDAYWIYAATPFVVTIQVQEEPGSKSLQPGWNLISPTGFTPRKANEAFNSISWSYIIGFDGETQQYDLPMILGANDTIIVEPGLGYWIYVSHAETLSF